MDLTSEQRMIIEAEASDLAVVAGAGSGKTHVLVERYLQLLSGCSIPQIAAITFTEAAAAEMRERVRRAVMSDPSLEQHRELLDEAAIGTVHSLGLRLLREHPVEAGLDPAAAVLPDDEAELLRRAACIEAIDAAAEADDERTTALRGIGVYHAGLRLPRMVAERDAVERPPSRRWARTAPAGPPACAPSSRPTTGRGRRRSASGRGRSPAQIRRDADAVSERLAEIVHAVLAAARLRPARRTPGKTSSPSSATRRSRIRTCRRRAQDVHPTAVSVKNALQASCAMSLQCRGSARLPAWNEHDGPALEVLAGLRDLFKDAVRRYTAAKQAQGALDYLDLELGAVDLLRDHPAVAAAVRERFRHLMVDESQDINPVQAELIELIAAGDGDGPRPSALPRRRRAAVDLPLPRGGRAPLHRVAGARPPGEAGRCCRSAARSAATTHWWGVSTSSSAEVFAGTALSLAALPPMTGRPGEAPGERPLPHADANRE